MARRSRTRRSCGWPSTGGEGHAGGTFEPPDGGQRCEGRGPNRRRFGIEHLEAQQARHHADEVVLELGQALGAAGADLLGHELGDRHDEQAWDEGRHVALGTGELRQLLEELAEAGVLAVALLDRARPGGGQLDEVGAREGRALGPEAQVDRRAAAQDLDPILALERGQLVVELGGQLVAEREEARGLVGEQRVEGVARHARVGDDLRHRRGGVAALGHAGQHRLQQALALRRPDHMKREVVPPLRQRSCLDFRRHVRILLCGGKWIQCSGRLSHVSGGLRAALACVLFLVLAPAAQAASYGSGVFGTWGADHGGLRLSRYTIEEDKAPAAAQPELGGKRDAWHQLGNDHVVANAYNHGYVQLWSQDRLYQWANYYEAGGKHFSGGFGWLRTDGRTYSTLYDDRPAGTDPARDFGTGYFARTTPAGGIDVGERTYAPFGDDPVLLHEITLHNTTRATKRASWVEYWDVNPYFPGSHTHLGLEAPVWDGGARTLSVRQLPSAQDTDPLTIYAAALTGPLDGYETSSSVFFGAGSRAEPAEVAADKLSGSLAPPVPDGNLGQTLFAFRAPVTLAPGETVTLRYAYGMARGATVAPLVTKYRAVADPAGTSERAWADFVPHADFGPRYDWLARELAWDAYMVRSGTTYEECAGRHIISQGGYYQYDLDFQGAFRDPLQHMLPLVYAAPGIARDVIAYSAQEQPANGGQIPYAVIPQCQRFDLGTSDDLDLWLLLSAAEYGLATRDLRLFDEKVKWSDNGDATLWEHLEAAFAHQETQRGPHGGYIIGGTGDWSDFSTQFLQMTESMLVAAQAAVIYPRLAELADARGDKAFAGALRDTARGLRDVLKREWTGKGWYSRGYSGDRQLGQGVIYGEPQPWALLAGVADDKQRATLVANIRRFLTGVGAPGGPSKIGSSQSPAARDPGVTETSAGGDSGVGDGHAVYVGGSWFAVNGWLAWALGAIGDREYAFDELVRNTLATHATVYPDHWDGVISTDDACRSWYSKDPANCGVGLSTAYAGQIMHQPAWALFDAVKLAGVEPTADGYRIVPSLPMKSFSFELPRVGVTAAPGALRGYVRPEAGGVLRMRVAAPAGAVARVEGRRVASSREGGLVVFSLPARADVAAHWEVAVPRRVCTSRRHIVVHVRGARVTTVRVSVDKRRVRSFRGGRISLRGLPAGRVRVRIVAVKRGSGRRVTQVRSYRTCA